MYILYNRLITALNEKKPDSTEFYIAKMMIWNLWELPRMSISDVAKMCAVSKSTISKFVRDIGFEDYLDFKLEAVRQGKKEIYNSNGKCNITDYIRGHGIWEYEKILSEDIRSVLFGIEEDQLKRLAVDLHEYKHLAAFGISYSESAAINAGIKVILVDSVIDKEIANGVVATDNFKAGKELGTFAKTILKPDSKIGVVAHVKGSSTATEREDGIREGLGEDQNRIQDIVYCNSSYDLASDLTEKMLKERPEIDVVIGTNEYSAVGAARGVKKMGMEDQVKVVGFDNSVEQIQLLEAGVFQGIVIQKPFNIGYLGVEQAVKAIEGYPMEYNLDSGCKLITKENMYEEENQRLLYSFSGQQ